MNSDSQGTGGPVLAAKWALFRLFERVSDWRSSAMTDQIPGQRPGPQSVEAAAAPGIWMYVSTIGELNAIEPFTRRLLQAAGHPPLTLITDRDVYDAAFQARHREACIVRMNGSTRAARELARTRPPMLLVVAEIPAMLHDAPCRFSFATVLAARQAGAAVVLVNGWLYGYTPPSRLDWLEHRLFARDYVQAFDLMLVQTAEVQHRLQAAGAPAHRLAVTGNIKLDAVRETAASLPTSPLFTALAALTGRPVIVAGSLADITVQAAVVHAFVDVLQVHPDALLVIAPRHPENDTMMQALTAVLDGAGLRWQRRTQGGDFTKPPCSVLVLDTMGELRDCYAAATLALVGTDHNVLEPLAFRKSVYVLEGWNHTYPSYPVYRQLMDVGVLHSVANPEHLGAAWLGGLAGSETPRLEQLMDILRSQSPTALCLQTMRQQPAFRRLWADRLDQPPDGSAGAPVVAVPGAITSREA